LAKLKKEMEYLFSDVWDSVLEISKDCYIKKNAIEKSKQDIQTLILGNSLADCSIRTKIFKNVFNFGIRSLDIYYIFKLYEKYALELKKRLKNCGIDI